MCMCVCVRAVEFVQRIFTHLPVCEQVLENAGEKLKNAQTFQEYVEVGPGTS